MSFQDWFLLACGGLMFWTMTDLNNRLRALRVQLTQQKGFTKHFERECLRLQKKVEHQDIELWEVNNKLIEK
jgi:hypothetical protein